MARKEYSPKKIDLEYEEIEISPEELQQRLDDAFDLLFEETWKYIQEQKQERKEVYKDESNYLL